MSTPAKSDNNRNHTHPWLRDFFNVENLFDNDRWMRPFERSMPAINVSEDERNFIVEVIAPGFKKEELKLSIEDGMLTISAEMKKETTSDGKEYSRREYNYNSFTRSFFLPDNAKDENIEASYTDGILKLTIPKTEPVIRKPKNIDIK